MEGYRVVVRWNAAHFPSLMLWMSNRGRQFAPWNGRHLALGIEPICGPFDFGADCALRDTPLTRSGIATAVKIAPNMPFTTRYALSLEEL